MVSNLILTGALFCSDVIELTVLTYRGAIQFLNAPSVLFLTELPECDWDTVAPHQSWSGKSLGIVRALQDLRSYSYECAKVGWLVVRERIRRCPTRSSTELKPEERRLYTLSANTFKSIPTNVPTARKWNYRTSPL